jgi:hypothetical protein
MSQLECILAKMEPYLNGGLTSCAQDLVEQATASANTKNAAGVPESKSAALQEWYSVEKDFLKIISEKLQCDQKILLDLLQNVQRILANSKQLGIFQEQKKRSNRIGAEVAELRQELEQKQESLKRLRSAQAPSSLLECQALSQLAGFQLESYNDTSLELCCVHSINKDVETRFSFDIQNGSYQVTLSNEGGQTSDSASVFHRYFLNFLARKQVSIIQEQLDTEGLHGAISTLSWWLGRLDAATLDLQSVLNHNYSIYLAMPQIFVDIAGSQLRMEYQDPERFVPTTVSLVDSVTGKIDPVSFLGTSEPPTRIPNEDSQHCTQNSVSISLSNGKKIQCAFGETPMLEDVTESSPTSDDVVAAGASKESDHKQLGFSMLALCNSIQSKKG